MDHAPSSFVRAPTKARPDSRSPTPARGSRPRSAARSSTRSSRPSPRASVRASGSPSATGSPASTAAASGWSRSPGRERASPSRCLATRAAAAGGDLTVLVVDDEIALRNALLRFLTRRGIRGEGVSDGAEALRVLQQRNFDVIISDVRMPGMSGREFLERLGRDRPDLVPRVVLSTGDTFAPDTAALLKESGVPTVTKPFDFAMLERVLREVATRAAAGRPNAAG